MKFLGTLESKEFDELAVQKYGLTLSHLMENAGRRVAEAVSEFMIANKLMTATVFCGPGNNGGDGKFAAGILEEYGFNASTVLLGDDMGESAFNSDLLVDALFGFGINRPIGDVALQVISKINRCRRPIISIDLPSGIDADGKIWGTCIRANLTVCLAFPKKAFSFPSNWQFFGQVLLADIGAPSELYSELGMDKRALFHGQKIYRLKQ